jgi:hypothetical protein
MTHTLHLAVMLTDISPDLPSNVRVLLGVVVLCILVFVVLFCPFVDRALGIPISILVYLRRFASIVVVGTAPLARVFGGC